MNPVFCIRCGTKLDVKTGKCPACDSEKRVQSEESYDKTEYYDEYAEDLLSSEKVNNNNPKNRKKLLIVAAALIFCFVFVFSGVVTYMVIAPEDKNIFSAVFSDDEDDKSINKQQGSGESSGTKGMFDESDVPEGAVSFGGHRYFVIDDPSVTNCSQAIRYCEERNGYLATVTSAEENDFLFSYLCDNYDFTSVYFGMSDAGVEGEWKWTNGEKVSFFNWASGEPEGTNAYYDYARFCADRENGKWYTGGFDEISSEHIDVTIVSASSSSYLSEENIIHTPDKIADGLLATSWVEGVSGYGVGQEITLTFDDVYNIDGFVINAGYQRSERLYDKNSRPSEILLTFSDGTSESFLLDDIFRSQHINLTSPVMTDSVTLTILSAYRGTSFDDTAIAEISFSAVESNPMFLCEWGTY